MAFSGDLRQELIARTLRVPAVDGASGDGAAVARQLDVALLSAGFTCSRALLVHLSALHPVVVRDAGDTVLRAVRELVGDHVRHNAYFIDFPANVPSTQRFWAKCVAEALLDERSAGNVAQQLARGAVNLLHLPIYGRFQHTYEELLAAHEELSPSVADRVTILHLGDPLAQESHALYLQFASSPIPLSEGDLGLLGELAPLHVDDAQPETVEIRESRAVIDAARVVRGHPLSVDTVTDVLRVACALSRGDVTLVAPTRFASFPRAHRRALLAALDAVVAANPAKLADVNRHAEPFKRLGERLHPHEYPRYAGAADAFAVARGSLEARSLIAKVEIALAEGRPDDAVAILAAAPGMLIRAVDRLARSGADLDRLAGAVRGTVPAASTRVLLSLREHLLNRDTPAALRLFVNQRARAWTAADERDPLDRTTIDRLAAVLDTEIGGRLPRIERLVVDPGVRSLAVPLTGKGRPDGFGQLPRGSTGSLGPHVRFFIYWKQRARHTDYDLSVQLLDEDFTAAGQVSWTNLTERGVVYSGDITSAPSGASEFIDLDLGKLHAHYVIPQINIYSGESFDEVEEAFFGFMQREPGQQGRPFEPRTVRAKSDLAGPGRVALPLLFARGEADGWHAKWLHLNLAGSPAFNRVEGNLGAASRLVLAVAAKRYLPMTYIEGLLRAGGATVSEWPAALDPSEPVTYLGLERPDGLPPGSTVYTPANLPALLSSA